MSNDQLSILLGTVIGLVIIPWCAWVTTSIFNLKTQTALFKAELQAVKRIEDAVEKIINHR
jgi:uncharacterized membrane protein YciS (DUF1049 family)